MNDGPKSGDARELPASRLGRVAQLAGMGARAGAKRLFAGRAAGVEEVADALGTLRGIAAKVGQIASYVDGVIPEAHSDLFNATFGKLLASAPTSPPAAVRQVIEEELGQPIDRAFATFEEIPFASASIGQVHRATLPDGRRVAVKVQHPGVAEAVESDLSNISVLESLVGPLGARKIQDSKNVLAVLTARFREELDYRLEAQRQTAFRALHAGDPTIRIPEIIAERSAGRVMTSEFVDGVGLAEAARAPEALRRSYAETMWRFVFKSNFVGKLFNADPHPANYVFQPDGGVYFLDFGCVQPLDAHWERWWLAMHLSAMAQDEAAFSHAVTSFMRTKGGGFEAAMLRHSRNVFEPVFRSPHHITRNYARGLFLEAQDIGKTFAKKGELILPPPEMTVMSRHQFGFYSVLARLDVAADYASAARAVQDAHAARAG